MPFGLGKPEKRPGEEIDPAEEETLEADQGAPAADPDGSDPLPVDQPDATRQPEEAPGAMAFRPAFLDSGTPREQGPAVHPPKGDAFFVCVATDGETETHRFDEPTQAQTFVEHLLEEGVPQEEMTAFIGHRMALKVTHRPVVKLSTGQDE
jgi:hypothetical protein